MKKLQMQNNDSVYENIMNYLEPRVGSFESMDIDKKVVIINKLQRACKSCALHYETEYENIPSRLNKDGIFLFIGRNPNGNEGKSNTLFPVDTNQGNMFKKYLSVMSIGEGEISILNMCQCVSKKNRPLTSEEINKCIAFKKMELQCLPNIRVIFPMGQDSIKWLFGQNHPGAMQTFGDIYDTELNGKSVKVCPLLHPSQVLMDKSTWADMNNVLHSYRKVVEDARLG